MWWFLAYSALAFVAVMASMPKPQTRPPAGLNEFNVPTAELGREIPVLFGERDISGPNVVWYGDLRTIPIKSSGGKK